jgi:hypothetical protein
MTGSQACPRCGAMVASDAAWCGRCSWSRTAAAVPQQQWPAPQGAPPKEPLVGLGHANGVVAVVQTEVVNATHGKNLVTRKEWQKEERIPVATLRNVLVQSHDRVTFRFDAADTYEKVVLSIEGCTSKPELDSFLRDLVAANPNVVVELAHPSFGLRDPQHDAARNEANRAIAFNQAEEKRRNAALGARPEVKVKTYDNPKDYEHDARQMAKGGWIPEGQTGTRGGASLAGTGAKLLLTGGLGAITGFSHKGDKITVTWVKQPPGFVPKDYLVVPEVPAPRTYPHEPYFTATLVAPVRRGEEFAVGSPLPPAAPSAPAPAVQPPSESLSGSSGSPSDKLRQLAALRDEGLISSEECEATKAEILRSG